MNNFFRGKAEGAIIYSNAIYYGGLISFLTVQLKDVYSNYLTLSSVVCMVIGILICSIPSIIINLKEFKLKAGNYRRMVACKISILIILDCTFNQYSLIYNEATYKYTLWVVLMVFALDLFSSVLLWKELKKNCISMSVLEDRIYHHEGAPLKKPYIWFLAECLNLGLISAFSENMYEMGIVVVISIVIYTFICKKIVEETYFIRKINKKRFTAILCVLHALITIFALLKLNNTYYILAGFLGSVIIDVTQANETSLLYKYVKYKT